MNETTARVLQEALAERFRAMGRLNMHSAHAAHYVARYQQEIRELLEACDMLNVPCQGFKNEARSFIEVKA